MRRAVVTLLAVLIFAVGSSSALAATSQRVTIRALIAQAGWEEVKEETGAGEFGVAEFATAEGRTTIMLGISKGELALCEGGDTPDDPSDDVYGFQGTETMGEGPAKLSLGKSYSKAIASGTVQAEVFTFDECSGDTGTVRTMSIRVSMTLTGFSPIITQTSKTTLSIPDELRAKTFIRSEARQAAGTLTIGSRTLDVSGAIGKLSLKGSATSR